MNKQNHPDTDDWNRICNAWNGYTHDDFGRVYVCPGWPHKVDEQ